MTQARAECRSQGSGLKFKQSANFQIQSLSYTQHPNKQTPQSKISLHLQIWEAQRAQIERSFNIPMIRRVFETSDVIGISHYAPSPATGVNAGMFAMPIDTAAFELAHWGVDLKVGISEGGGELGNRSNRNNKYDRLAVGPPYHSGPTYPSARSISYAHHCDCTASAHTTIRTHTSTHIRTHTCAHA